VGIVNNAVSAIINTYVIPTISHGDLIFRCIESLRKHCPPNFRVIVVNMSQPNSEFENRLYDSADIIIRTHKNFGFAQASNMGIRLAPTKYVTVSNDDVQVMPLFWEGIEETFELFPTAIGVNPESPLEPGWGYGQEGWIEHMEYKDDFTLEDVAALKQIRPNRVVDGICTWCTVFKREELVRDVGLFDELFTPGGGEDYCLNARAYQAGYRMLGSSHSWAWHWWGMSKGGGRAKDGTVVPLPSARPPWNKLSGDGGLWDPDCNVWGKDCVRTTKEIHQAPL